MAILGKKFAFGGAEFCQPFKILNWFKICIVVLGIFGQMAFASPISKSCIDEFAKLPATKDDFDIKSFLANLPVEIGKVKAQLKIPFGKPSDSKLTGIGITVGCLKQFPESASEVVRIVKEQGIEIIMTVALEAVKRKMESDANPVAANSSLGSVQPVQRKDIIYLQNGQEIGDAIVAEIGIEEVKYKIGTRTVVYVAKKTDISSILYADGVKDFFCNGISYNSATHFCYTDDKTYSCGNKPYNPAIQSCSGDIIYNKCGNNFYNSITHFCHTDFQTYSCGNKPYNPAIHFCLDNAILLKCDDKTYNPATQLCLGNKIYQKCSDNPYNYNSLTHFCHTDGRTYSCGNKPYNPTTQVCRKNTIYEKCGDKPYNPAIHFCLDNAILLKCDDKTYNPATQLCLDNKIYQKCSDNPYNYNSLTHFCHTDGRIYSCGGKPYNPTTQVCSNNTIHRKCYEGYYYNSAIDVCEPPENPSDDSDFVAVGIVGLATILFLAIMFL
ncbi:MAG: hypothetical protein FWB90_07325 [Fibromonadales bacterium]|nr:hypothetical protein [Fibromonadales bacterium]